MERGSVPWMIVAMDVRLEKEVNLGKCIASKNGFSTQTSNPKSMNMVSLLEKERSIIYNKKEFHVLTNDV